MGLFPRPRQGNGSTEARAGGELMGQYFFRLPDIGEGVAEAEITAWHVKPGDTVHEDGPLLDVMTDKATVDMTSPVDGTVIALHGEVGSKAPVGSVLVE